MTTGQRISEKRKELGLSQEALGEKLSVSRQSIYKWESDSSLPDIDKLIALSRLFGVSVGWLLGVEDDIPSHTAEEPTPEDWNQWQQTIVEETLRRYQAAQPKPQKSVWDKWSVRFLFAICGLMLGVVFSINAKIDNLDSKYRTLESSVDQISSDTRGELDAMADHMATRLETILKSQSELAVDYDCEISSFDLAQETITFSLSIVPKTYVNGMNIFFQANSSGEIAEAAAQQITSQTFAGELTCPLSDSISITAIFQSGDTRQMQLLNEYTDLYSSSLPGYHINDTAINDKGVYQTDGAFRMNEQYVYFGTSDDLSRYKTDLGIIEIESVEVGLFLNQELVHWLEPCGRPTRFDGVSANGHSSWTEYFHDGFTFFYSPQADGLTVQEGDTIHFAARVTDCFGRVTMVCSKTRYVMRNGQLLTLENQFRPEYYDPTQYKF